MALAITAGDTHTCIRLNVGVRCWGFGVSGQLGYGTTASIGDDEFPTSAGLVELTSDGDSFSFSVDHLAAGWEHSCAISPVSGVRCWGRGEHGRLGYGNTENVGDDEVPGSIPPIGNWGIWPSRGIASGMLHTCAADSYGDVHCWGAGDSGQLGNGNTETIGDDEALGVVGHVDIGEPVIQLAAGGSHTCSLSATGHVHCWGRGAEGQLGYGNTENIGDDETPASAGHVDVGWSVVQIAAGEHHTCALLTGGDLLCWGANDFGQLGYGHTETIGDDETPASVGYVGGSVVQIAAGKHHTCALLTGGAFFAGAPMISANSATATRRPSVMTNTPRLSATSRLA